MPQLALIEWGRQRGYKVGYAGIDLLETVRNRIETRQGQGDFAPGFFDENLTVFKYLEGISIPRSLSLVIVVVPRPAHVLRFEFERGVLDTLLPPTYVSYRGLFESIRKDLEVNALGAFGSVETVQVPLKSLAACLGLVSYGRNNITYAPEFGSYFQLLGYVTDIPLGTSAENIQLERYLPTCSSCRMCLKACPTGAIAEDRFLLHAEKCYTLHSESLRPIPAHMKPPSPDCLIGCLKCQQVCPVNKGHLRKEYVPVSFTREETSAMIEEGDFHDEDLAGSIQAKFVTLSMTEDLPILRRNLRTMVKLKAERRS